jgi:sugar phosphate isomerase/epimerase
MSRREFTSLLASAAGSMAVGPLERKAPMKLSLSEISTVSATFQEDVHAYAEAGFDAIGIWEFKLPNDDSVIAALHSAGLSAANCVPAVPSFLPLRIPGMEGPPDLAERIAKICASISRLAHYRPSSVLILTGPMGELEPAAAHRIVVDGLRKAAAAARAAGVRLGLEPIHPMQRETVSFVNSIADAVALLKDADADDVGIMADTYNLWEEAPADLAAVAHRVTGLHVADVPREPGRTDRVLPGEGGTRSAALASALLGAGWSGGFLDVEIFSTRERFWGLPVNEAASRAHAAVAALRRTLA